jgi:hypothetical protein
MDIANATVNIVALLHEEAANTSHGGMILEAACNVQSSFNPFSPLSSRDGGKVIFGATVFWWSVRSHTYHMDLMNTHQAVDCINNTTIMLATS